MRQVQETETNAASRSRNSSWFGGGGPRALILDEDSPPGSPVMSERHPGSLGVMGLSAYPGVPSADGVYISRVHEGGVFGSASGQSLVALPEREGAVESDELVSHIDPEAGTGFGASVTALRRPPRSSARPIRRSSSDSRYTTSVLEPSAWLGGYDDMLGSPTSLFATPLPSPTAVASRPYLGLSSTDGFFNQILNAAPGASGGSSEEHQHLIGGSAGIHEPGSTVVSRRSSMQGYGISSFHGHGYTSAGGSSSGHGRPESTGGGGSSSHGDIHAPSIHRRSWNESQSSSGPSSLLPSTQSQAPPTAYKRCKATEGDRSDMVDDVILNLRARGFLGRPLKWRARGDRPLSASFSGSPSIGIPTLEIQKESSVSRPTSIAVSDRTVVVPSIVIPSPLTSPRSAKSVPTLPISLGGDASRSHLTVPNSSGLETIDRSLPERANMFSPALSDLSNHGTTDGLLDPRLGVHTPTAMGSTSALSLRDDMDYSRPIGGVSGCFALCRCCTDRDFFGLCCSW